MAESAPNTERKCNMPNLTPQETRRRLSEAEGKPVSRQLIALRAIQMGQISGYDEGWVLQEVQIRRVRRRARDIGYAQRAFLPIVTKCACGLPAAIWHEKVICPDHITRLKGLKRNG